MRLLRLSEVEIGPNDRVFRHPRIPALIVWLGLFCGAAAMFLYALAGKWKPGYVFGPAILPFLLLTLRFVTARFHPSNWLVRVNETGLSAQYRSYLNYRLPADEPSVVFISYSEIASARLVRERVQTPDPSHNPSASKSSTSSCATSPPEARSLPPSTSRAPCTAAAWWRRRSWWRG